MEDFDLLSFPPEILANIFSNIPWNQLINVKLTARKFNNVTEKYLKHMQKPKLRAIYFNDNFIYNDGIEKIKVGYVIIINSVNGIHYTSDGKEFFLLPSELDKLHNFLKKVDLTFLNLVHIKINIHTKVIRIFSGYFRNTNTIDFIFFVVRNSDKSLDNILPFFQKIQSVRFLDLCLPLPYQNVPRDFIIPVRNSLRMLFIHEGKDTAFVNPKMIKYIVENNPDLTIYNLNFDSLKTYRMVIEAIVNGVLSKNNSGCLHTTITISLYLFQFEGTSELLNYLYSEEFPYNVTNNYNGIENPLYTGKLRCPVCGEFDSIKIN